MDDLIKRSDAIEAIEVIDWYHQNKNKDMVSGANSDEHQAWYKADDVYKALEAIPSADRPQEWIPCSEILPEYRKTVLISTFWGVKMGFLDNTEAYGDFGRLSKMKQPQRYTTFTLGCHYRSRGKEQTMMTDKDIQDAVENCKWRKDLHGVWICEGDIVPCLKHIDDGRCDTLIKLFAKEGADDE